MISVDQAIDAIMQHAPRLLTQTVPLSQANGRILASNVISQWNSPPFDKSLMDGYALCFAVQTVKDTQYQIVETITAGQVPTHRLQPGEATRIMTGAMLPEQTTGVAPLEVTEQLDSHTIKLKANISPDDNLMRTATSIKQGQQALTTGQRLGVAQIGLLAEIGESQVVVTRRPRIAILSTGDELVDYDCIPETGQIRNSNQIMLASQLQPYGEPECIGIARDNLNELQERMTQGLSYDMLLLTGGVSVGDKDYVPMMLKKLNVETVFHGLKFKPGKPLYFGHRLQSPGNDALVFGLPGNPVSSLICCEVFVKTALRTMLGLQPFQPQPLRAVLGHEFFVRGNRPTYYPSRICTSPNGLTVSTVKWHGSADLASTTNANGMILFHEAGKTYQKGELVEVMIWGNDLQLPLR